MEPQRRLSQNADGNSDDDDDDERAIEQPAVLTTL
jgi:hypothetical protein